MRKQDLKQFLDYRDIYIILHVEIDETHTHTHTHTHTWNNHDFRFFPAWPGWERYHIDVVPTLMKYFMLC